MTKQTEPRVLSEKELEHVSGGKLTTANPGGQQHGASQITSKPARIKTCPQAYGKRAAIIWGRARRTFVVTEATNPSGNHPPGHQSVTEVANRLSQ